LIGRAETGISGVARVAIPNSRAGNKAGGINRNSPGTVGDGSTDLVAG
jgi:hypothetical protein